MFKGLKSKLEDEAKRLSATATQYAGNIAQQVRSGASDAGSDISGYTKKFLNTVQTEGGSPQPGMNPVLNEENLISLDDDDVSPNTSATVPAENEPLERTRRLSDASIESNDSSLSALYGSVLNHSSANPKLETISSDVESIFSDGGWESSENTSKEQLRSILDDFRGRAVNYKEKYHDVVKRYNDSVRENEKLKLVLTKTQDKTLKRIEKLREENLQLKNNSTSNDKDEKIARLSELLERCRETIKNNKVKVAEMAAENAKLKEQQELKAEIEKVNSEWKGRIDRVTEEFTTRLSANEEKAAIAIATVKAENHEMLQVKDQEIEKWINKCHSLEKSDTAAGERYEQQISQLHKTITALESEKADMVEKLSKAKQEGVKLVQEEEEKKRLASEAAYQQKVDKLESELAEMKKYSEEHADEQLLATELQKKLEELQTSITRNLKLWEDERAELTDKLTKMEEQNAILIEEHAEKQKMLESEHEETLSGLKEKIVEAKKIYAQKDADMDQEIQSLRNDIAKLEAENVEHAEKATKHNEIVERLTHQYQKEIEETKQKMLHDLHKDSDERTGAVLSQLDDLLGRIAVLESSIAEKEMEINKQRKMTSALEEQLEPVFAGLSTFREKLTTDEDKRQFDSLTPLAQVEFLQSKFDSSKEEVHKPLALNSHQAEFSAIFGEQFSAEKMDQEAVNDVVTRLLDRIREDQKNLEESQQSILSANEKLKHHEESLQQKGERLAALETENEKLTSEIHKLNSSLESCSENDNQTLEEAQRHLSGLTEYKNQTEILLHKVADALSSVSKEGELFERAKFVVDELLNKSQEMERLAGELEKERRHVEELEKQDHENDAATLQKLQKLQASFESLMETNQALTKEKEDFVESIKRALGGGDANANFIERIEELTEIAEKQEELEASLQITAKNAEQLAQRTAALETVLESISLLLEFDGEGDLSNFVEQFVTKQRAEKAELEELRVQIANMKKQHEFLEKEMAVFKQESSNYDQLKQEFVAQESRCAELEKTLAELQKPAHRHNRVFDLLADFNDHRDFYRLLSDVNGIIHEDHKDKHVETSATLQELKKNEASREEVTRLQEQLSTHSQNKVTAEKKYSDLERSHEDLRSQFLGKERFIEDLRNDLQRQEANLAQEREAKQVAIDEVEALRREIDQLTSVHGKQTQELQTAMNGVRLDLLKEKEELSAELAKCKITISDLEQAVQQGENQKEKMESANKQFNELSTEVAKWKSNAIHLLVELTEEPVEFPEAEVPPEQQLRIVHDLLKEAIEKTLSDRQSLESKYSQMEQSLKDTTDTRKKEEVAVENNNRKMKTLEKEMRDVYRSLEKKTMEFENATARIKELEQELIEAREVPNGHVVEMDHADPEEMEALRRQVGGLKEENEELQNMLKHRANANLSPTTVEAALEMRSVANTNRARLPSYSSEFNTDNAKFAEPTEAEYLRNVLYRYMVERESLGKEIVTLAKVICKVLKFTPPQVDTILQKEEHRTHGWIEDTMGAVLKR